MQSTHAQSEERFKQSQAAKEALAQANKRKEPEEIFEEVAKLAEQAQQVQAVVEPAPVAKEALVDTRRKKQARPDKERDDFDHEEDGPRKQQKNRSSQSQVRNQRNSNWNNNKKNKKGNNKNNRNQTPKPVTERKFHELPTEFEYTDGMTVAEIAKRIKREPAEIVKKLFIWASWPHKTNPWMGKRLNSSWWITVSKPNKRLKWIMPTSNVSLSKMVISMKMNWLSVHQL